MNHRDAMAAHVASKRVLRAAIPPNGICPATGLYYFTCRCDNHRCGDCGRRWSQRDMRGTLTDPIPTCQCERNRRHNGFPPHWRTGLIASSG